MLSELTAVNKSGYWVLVDENGCIFSKLNYDWDPHGRIKNGYLSGHQGLISAQNSKQLFVISIRDKDS